MNFKKKTQALCDAGFTARVEPDGTIVGPLSNEDALRAEAVLNGVDDSPMLSQKIGVIGFDSLLHDVSKVVLSIANGTTPDEEAVARIANSVQ